jgi:hypothetical protein
MIPIDGRRFAFLCTLTLHDSFPSPPSIISTSFPNWALRLRIFTYFPSHLLLLIVLFQPSPVSSFRRCIVSADALQDTVNPAKTSNFRRVRNADARICQRLRTGAMEGQRSEEVCSLARHERLSQETTRAHNHERKSQEYDPISNPISLPSLTHI